jgi:RNA polymerase sigma-70 factor, ECF subfamily
MMAQTCVTSAGMAAGEDSDILVARLRRADASAVAEVYDRHAEAVFGFARRLVGDEAAAEDLVHEVFVTLPKAIQRYEGTAALRTFLLSIAVNHSRHHVRAAARRRAAMTRYSREAPSAPSTPEEETLRADLSRALLEALDELPIEQRVAFVLCEVEERTAAEAAAIAAAPEATMRSRVFHAKKKLRDLLSRRGIR